MNFEDIYKTYYWSVAKVVQSFRLNEGDHEDAIQETFIKAWKHQTQLKKTASLKSWLNTIAANVCRGILKSNKKNPSLPTSQASEIGLVFGCPQSFDEKSFNFEISVELLRSLVRESDLGIKSQVAHAFYLEEKSVHQISTELNLNKNTVLTHLRRFRLLISKAMLDLVDKEGIEITTQSPYQVPPVTHADPSNIVC